MFKILGTGADGFVVRMACAALIEKEIDFIAPELTEFWNNDFLTGDLSASTEWLPALVGCISVQHLAARIRALTHAAEQPINRVNVLLPWNAATQLHAPALTAP